MRSRYRISVGGVHLDSLDDNLLILDISNPQPDRNIKKQTVANLNGYSVADTQVGQQSVTVTFELHIYNIAERNAALQKVNAWASAGGTLVINERSGQRLYNVICEQYADIQSSRNWTDPLTIVFSTTAIPYWQSTATKTLTLTGKNASGTLVMDGNTDSANVGVTVTAAAALTSLQVKVGNTIVKLTGLNVPAGKQVVIDYVGSRYLRIRANGSNAMKNLDPTSSDLLQAKCGASNAVSVTANAKVTTVLAARGCWL